MNKYWLNFVLLRDIISGWLWPEVVIAAPSEGSAAVSRNNT